MGKKSSSKKSRSARAQVSKPQSSSTNNNMQTASAGINIPSLSGKTANTTNLGSAATIKAKEITLDEQTHFIRSDIMRIILLLVMVLVILIITVMLNNKTTYIHDAGAKFSSFLKLQ